MSNAQTATSVPPAWPTTDLLRELEAKYVKEGLKDFWSQEKQRVEISLKALHLKLGKRFTPSPEKPILGVGGSGIVVRLVDSKFVGVDVALKFPRPVAGKISLLAEMLQKEIAQLARLRHPGIVRIIYYDTADLDKVSKLTDSVPFYIMELVEGQKSQDFVRDPKISESQLTHLITETVKIVTYLHHNPIRVFIHLDLKPDNIVINSSGDPVLIDLGTCKQKNDDDNKTVVATTRSFADPRLVRRLDKDPTDENRSKGELRRSEIDPAWDLWALGNTILAWIGLDRGDGTTQRDSIFQRLSPYTRKYLLLLVARLHVDFLPNWLSERIGLSSEFLSSFRIDNANHLLDLLRRLQGSSSPLAEIPELSSSPMETMQAAPGQHVLNSKRLEKLLGHRLFRRLNSITQLGLVSLVYPGAKHTRREHSLGTYANTGKFVAALYNDPVSPLFKQIISAQDCRDVLLTALLHDLGQYPMAHDLEEVDEDLFSHTDLTAAMLRSRWNKKKKGSKEIIFDSFDGVFADWGSSADRITEILAAKPSSATAHPKSKLLRSIISGPIDADKLDYLFRDARYLNLPYPFGTDVERLYRCLTTVVIEKVEGVKNVPAIGIYSKGRIAAEFLSFARYAMFSQAYWHHAVRAQKAMLARAVTALLEECKTEQATNELISDFYEFICNLPEILYASPQRELFKETSDTQGVVLYEQGRGTDLAATDAAVLSWLSERLEGKGLPEQKLIEGILKRKLFKRLWVIAHDDDEKRWREIVRGWEDLKRSKRHKLGTDFESAISKSFKDNPHGTTDMAATTALEMIKQKTSAKQPWLIVDIPGDRPGSQVGLYCVREKEGRKLRKDDRVVGDLQESGVWTRYAGGLRGGAGKLRIFCDPDLVEVVDATIKQTSGLDSLIDVLKQLK